MAPDSSVFEVRIFFGVVVLLSAINTIYFLYGWYARSFNRPGQIIHNNHHPPPQQAIPAVPAAGTNEVQELILTLLRENQSLKERVRSLEKEIESQNTQIIHMQYQLNIPGNESPFRIVLRNLMEETLNEEDVISILFELGFGREEFPLAISTENLILRVIQFAEHRGIMPELLEALKRNRPNKTWPILPPKYLRK